LETLLKPNYRLAENEATRLLNEAGIYSPPVNPIDVSRFLGVRVSFVSFTGDSSQISGLFDFTTDTIMVNKDEPGVRQTFTIAHELGHRVMHQDWAASDNYSVLWRDPTKQKKDRREQEANVFAASLLMPREMVKRYRHLDIQAMARLFAVSEQVVNNRLNSLRAYGY
jgi:Zn-dependent peptidase ImmA (M78 family)